MTTELRGLPLLDAAIAHIEAHPETWVQGNYRCESGMCLAGWIGELTGARWAAGPGDVGLREYVEAAPDELGSEIVLVANDENLVHVADRADLLLGFDGDVRFVVDGDGGDHDLFDGHNDLAEIKLIRDLIAAGGAS
jgi:hypothetical protein